MATLTSTQLNLLNSLKAGSSNYNASTSSNTLTSVNVANIGANANRTDGYTGECVSYVKNARPELNFSWGNALGGATAAAKQGFHVDDIPVVGSAFVIQPGGSFGTHTSGGVTRTYLKAASAGHTGIVTGVNYETSTDSSGNAKNYVVVNYKDYNGLGTGTPGTGTIKFDLTTLTTDPWKFIWGKETDYTSDRNAIMGEINKLFSNGLLTGTSDVDSINKLVNRFFLANTAEKHNNLINLVELYHTEGSSPVSVYTLANGQFTNEVLAGAKVGTGLSETMNGGAGNDVFMGGAGNDTLIGNDGNDVLRGGLGDDSMNGGNGNDTMQGGVGNDRMDAGNGDDKVYGDAGNDTLNGGLGNDIIDGGIGIDTVSYLNIASGVNVNLWMTQAQNTGGAGIDTITNVENVSGTAYNDTLTGNGGDNVIDGREGDDFLGGDNGNDTLIGGTGNDRMDAGNGNDKLSGDVGNDILNGGAGNDIIDGGAGIDTVSYLNVVSGVVVNLSVVTAQNTGGAGYDTITNVENAAGTAFADTLTGNAGANDLNGREGNDILNGGAGNDTLQGGTGKDILTGGTGKDAFLFNTLPNTLTNVDKITDFNVIDDTIQLDNAAFTKLIDGALSSTMFRSGVNVKALDSNDYLLYNSQTGVLSYDADGSGAGAAVQVAQLGTNLALTSADFFVV